MAISGRIRGRGVRYADRAEALEIHIRKSESQGLPAEEGRRVSITLHVDGRRYNAGLRCTSNLPFLWICPDFALT
jgi:hypothetical protein